MSGRVFLVGAGPGDPELMTLRAARLLETAEAVVYDRLVSSQILKLVPAGATRIDVGKQPRHHPVPQEEINALLINLARAGRRVVRLKGGDPLMFGRGGEEAIALCDAGISFEVVPGITSAQGTAAAMMVPLTHRGTASSVRYLTGHRHADGDLDFDWKGLADPQTTLVVYMGLANIGEIAQRLISHGRAPRTPVMAVSKATRSEQEHLISTLGAISADIGEIEFKSPVLFIIGEVVGLAGILGVKTDDSRVGQMVAAE